MRTEVGHRLQAEATARRERVAALAALEREAREVERAIVALDADVAAARRARVSSPGAGRRQTPDEMQAEAREQWLRYRERQREKGLGSSADRSREATREQAHEAEPDEGLDQARDQDHTLDDDFSR